ncbi:U3 small nucleolar ribonucleoprotein MPP10 [Pyrus ussuriensis x Pyrus communis]|uniref:U3 small nucleolar ribonucleoprotein protein MPP10 n=1 Tax=Pyrus ussuriensis x Pyrus communis TaxID=2448454 RepID=A0A5N5GF36_9ROSA|nr:U3 small nucleolar ribonucleoprotein MPP10 [Pyrus ussuriensis x Pyrus communis]
MAINSDALNSLKATEPTQLLAPSPALSQTARAALQGLFSSIRPFTPKSPFDQLLVDGFDAEQIWQQIDLQSQPLISTLRRDLKRFEKNPDEIKTLKVVVQGEEKVLEARSQGLKAEIGGFDEELDGFDDDGDDEEAEDEEEEDEGSESEEVDREDEEEREESESEGEGNNAIEDGFFKIKDLKKSLEESEAMEYGLDKTDKKKKNRRGDDEDEEDEGLGDLAIGDDEDDEDKFARYEDFYGGKKEKPSKRRSKLVDESEDLGTNDGEEDEQDEEEDDQDEDDQEEGGENEQEDDKKQTALSTHEKKLKKLQSQIEQMEKANLEPKSWIMQGEVTAATRPKNSALEVDLDFEHNVRPAPVITEEVTTSIEDMIKKRIEEGRFDDVQKAPTLPSKAPREFKELDENKSKKGLADVYEEEYVQKTNLASAPLSLTDKQKDEASKLFKKLCLKLDALSHFHFSPKPVIEDMSVQANVPALAMEEIAPVAVSDAAMLAPEEVFSGKGDIKEETELTQAERKRRRANKKRKFKAREVKRAMKKPRDSLKDVK